MAIWDDFLTSLDKDVFTRAQYSRNLGLGRRPVLLVVDATYAFVGHERRPILDSIATWRNSCGERGWDAVAAIRTLLSACRSRDLPVIFTAGKDKEANGIDHGLWRGPGAMASPDVVAGYGANEIVRELAPTERDAVVRKTRPSAFFGTPLASYLTKLQADSLIVVGGTTSGCVRATVVDAFSYNYRVTVVEEGTFDRGEASHAIALFDMNSKYADVASLDATLAYLECGEIDGVESSRPAAPVS